ncbi:MAG: TrmH family RNA methyltransferase, partial [Pseudomonadota bacterium]
MEDLDGFSPHNLGAVARSAAHFGVKAIVRDVEDGRWTAAAFRTAEGGAEFIARVVVDDLADALFAIENNVDVIAMSFVRRPEDVLELKGLIQGAGASTPVV